MPKVILFEVGGSVASLRHTWAASLAEWRRYVAANRLTDEQLAAEIDGRASVMRQISAVRQRS